MESCVEAWSHAPSACLEAPALSNYQSRLVDWLVPPTSQVISVVWIASRRFDTSLCRARPAGKECTPSPCDVMSVAPPKRSGNGRMGTRHVVIFLRPGLHAGAYQRKRPFEGCWRLRSKIV